MKIANQQRVVIGVAVVAVLVLITTTIWSRPGFLFEPPSETEKQALNKKQQDSLAEYRKYLASIRVSPVASSLIFDDVIDKEALAAEIRADLGADKPVVVPEVKPSDLNVQPTADTPALERYIAELDGKLNSYHAEALPLVDQVFAEVPDKVVAARGASSANAFLDSLYKQPVPKPAAEMQASIASIYTSNRAMFADAEKASRLDDPTGQWKHTAQLYVTTGLQLENIRKMANQLAVEYGLPTSDGLAVDMTNSESNPFIKAAHAGLPVTVVVNIADKIKSFLQSAAGAAVLSYTKVILSKYIKNMEKNYLISSTLYYTQGLVNAKYANQYIKKFVEDPKDQQMVKSFLPQFNCGRANEDELRKNLQAQAAQYLGFDKNIPLDPTDPNFWITIARTAPETSDANGYILYYQGLAAVADAQATEAAKQEQANPGKKVPQKGGDILASLDSISAQQKAATQALFNIPIVNATTGGYGFAQYVTNVTNAVLKQFVIKGATTVKEQPKCIQVPVLNPVIPGDFTPRSTPPSLAEVKACQNDPDQCAETIFASPPPKILATCPATVSSIGRQPVVPEGLWLEAASGGKDPSYIEIGDKIELTWGIQPNCGELLESEIDTNDTPNELTVYGVQNPNYVPKTCDPEVNDPNSLNFDPTKPIVVVDAIKYRTDQFEGSELVDTNRLTARTVRDPNTRQLTVINQEGPQTIVAILKGVLGKGAGARPFCLVDSVTTTLVLPN